MSSISLKEASLRAVGARTLFGATAKLKAKPLPEEAEQGKPAYAAKMDG